MPLAHRLSTLSHRLAERPLWSGIALLLTAWVALLWPAVWNGQPFLLHDTTAYIRGAAFPAEKMFGLRTEWSTAEMPAVPNPASASVQAKAVDTGADTGNDKIVYSGRSVYYGAMLFAGYLVGGLWGPVIVQASLVALTMFMALRLMVPKPGLATAGALVGLGALTPLPWFTDYLMPDLFAGLGLLSAALLLAMIDRMTTGLRAFWFALLAFSLAAHSSHLATIVCVLVVTAVATWLLGGGWRPAGYAWTGAAIAIALIAEAGFNVAVTRVTGAAPMRPPFLTARVMSSTIGADYLRVVCPATVYAVCPFADRAPMVANDFLWHADPAIGVFSTVDPATRRAMSAEQMRVFIGAFVYAPATMTREMATRWWQLGRSVRLDEFNHGPAERAYFAAKLPTTLNDTLLATPSGQGQLPIGVLHLMFLITTMAGVIALVLLVPRDANTAMRDFALILIAGVLINAVVCSALSGVEPRYHARIVWLIPFSAYVMSLRRRDVWAWLSSATVRVQKPAAA